MWRLGQRCQRAGGKCTVSKARQRLILQNTAAPGRGKHSLGEVIGADKGQNSEASEAKRSRPTKEVSRGERYVEKL